MKAKIVCFKLSIFKCILILIILIQLGFIFLEVKELREVRKFLPDARKDTKTGKYKKFSK